MESLLHCDIVKSSSGSAVQRCFLLYVAQVFYADMGCSVGVFVSPHSYSRCLRHPVGVAAFDVCVKKLKVK